MARRTAPANQQLDRQTLVLQELSDHGQFPSASLSGVWLRKGLISRTLNWVLQAWKDTLSKLQNERAVVRKVL